jgi:hypothetical protein
MGVKISRTEGASHSYALAITSQVVCFRVLDHSGANDPDKLQAVDGD